ncbi:uncharacterized protein PV06_01890 [Exophiala oligosperma]|uniref:Uncharacterized protein n=1 Tax=Exophiala oligosperma TaxID=215243 RepID=A0A0D2C8Q2_9EURO|nr:uncharacterized protein PV06_01890 [Exophiala oligosperma]KIW46207.1 hypothetical protein PV06_01890 [Exophiala oligosperma]
MAANHHQLAEQRARLIHEQVQAVPVDQRGLSPFANIDPDTLPTSQDLSSGIVPADTQTLFPDALTADKYHDVMLQAKAGPVDSSIPPTLDMRKAHVRVLFMAFKCVPTDRQNHDSDADEDVEQIRKRDVSDAFKTQSHDNHMVEALCWKILDACIRRSRKEQNLVEGYLGEAGKSHGKRHSWTFKERFDKIVNTMARSKSVCKHLFDTPYMLRIVDDPVTSYKRVVSNKRLNQQKGQLMKRGKEAVEEDKRSNKRRKIEPAMERHADGSRAQASPVDSNTRSHRRTLVPIAPSTRVPGSGNRQDLASLQTLAMNSSELNDRQPPGEMTAEHYANVNSTNLFGRPGIGSYMNTGTRGMQPRYHTPRTPQMFPEMGYLSAVGPSPCSGEATEMFPVFSGPGSRSTYSSGDTASDHDEQQFWGVGAGAENTLTDNFGGHTPNMMGNHELIGYGDAGLHKQGDWEMPTGSAHMTMGPPMAPYNSPLLPSDEMSAVFTRDFAPDHDTIVNEPFVDDDNEEEDADAEYD